MKFLAILSKFKCTSSTTRRPMAPSLKTIIYNNIFPTNSIPSKKIERINITIPINYKIPSSKYSRINSISRLFIIIITIQIVIRVVNIIHKLMLRLLKKKSTLIIMMLLLLINL